MFIVPDDVQEYNTVINYMAGITKSSGVSVKKKCVIYIWLTITQDKSLDHTSSGSASKKPAMVDRSVLQSSVKRKVTKF